MVWYIPVVRWGPAKGKSYSEVEQYQTSKGKCAARMGDDEVMTQRQR
jgi:hypothetical protein